MEMSSPNTPTAIQPPMKNSISRRQRTSVQDLLYKGPLNVGSYFKASPEMKEVLCYNIFEL
jgi:hypothetical protein